MSQLLQRLDLDVFDAAGLVGRDVRGAAAGAGGRLSPFDVEI